MRSAIVGCGGIAHVHAKSLKALQDENRNIELVAAADCRTDRAEEFARIYEIKAYVSLEEMLDREQIDVLHICTPHYLHTPMIKEALRRGINVFSEKPPVISYEQWVELKKSAKSAKNGARLAFCFQNRYNDSIQYVKKLTAQKCFGELLGMRGFVTWSRDMDYYENSDWRGKLAGEGGGVLINQSIHTLDLMQYLCGKKSEQVSAVLDNQHLTGQIEVEDTMAAYIQYPNTRACFYASNAYSTNAPVLIDLEFEQAHVRIEENEVTIRTKDGQRIWREFPRQLQYGKSYWGTSHLACIEDFYCCLKNDHSCMLEWDQMEETVKLYLDVYSSARSK